MTKEPEKKPSQKSSVLSNSSKKKERTADRKVVSNLKGSKENQGRLLQSKKRIKKLSSEISWGEASARAIGRRLRVSPQKLNLVAGMIRGLSVVQAQSVLAFSVKRIARDVRKILLSAVANAEHNVGMDVDKLYVREASVGRALVMRRLDIKGRSRSGRIEKPLSHLRIIVSEVKG